MSKKAFITGITGQDGAYLAKVLLEKGYEVFGMVRNLSNPNLYGLEYLNIKDRVKLIFGDLSSSDSIKQALTNVAPDEIYHLAAQSSVIDSWEYPMLTFQTNAASAVVILEYVRQCPSTKLFIAQSSELYGSDPENHTNCVVDPLTPYAVSKLSSFFLSKMYREKYGLFIVNGIFYIHESPLRNVNFFCRKVTNAVARISRGLQDELVVGNIDLYRDIGFAGDYMEAVYAMLNSDTPRDYTVATGESTLLRDLVRVAFQEIGVDDYEKYVRLEKKYFRTADPVKLKGNSEDLFHHLGIERTLTPSEIIKAMVTHDLEILAGGKEDPSKSAIPEFF